MSEHLFEISYFVAQISWVEPDRHPQVLRRGAPRPQGGSLLRPHLRQRRRESHAAPADYHRRLRQSRHRRWRLCSIAGVTKFSFERANLLQRQFARHCGQDGGQCTRQYGQNGQQSEHSDRVVVVAGQRLLLALSHPVNQCDPDQGVVAATLSSGAGT